MENEKMEQFANWIKDKNKQSRFMQIFSLYAILFVWVTYCVMTDYAVVLTEQPALTGIVLLVAAANLLMYCVAFFDSYTKVEGLKGKVSQSLKECTYQMPFSLDNYLKLVEKKFKRAMAGLGVVIAGSTIAGMFVSGVLDENNGKFRFRWTFPLKMWKTGGVCIGFLVFFFLIVFFNFHILRYMFIKNSDESACKGKRKKKGNGIFETIVIAGTVIGLLAMFVSLFSIWFKEDSDPFLTISFGMMFIFLLVIKYWYISIAAFIILGTAIIWFSKNEYRTSKSQEKGKKNNWQKIMLHVGSFAICELCILCVLAGTCSLYHEGENLYSTTDVNEYGDFSGHWEGEEEERLSGLFIFPTNLSKRVKEEKYFYKTGTGLFGGSYEIYLEAVYPKEEYEAEKERLSKITCEIQMDGKEDIVTNEIWYVEDVFCYPAYVAVFENDSSYEYALLDEANRRIIYVFLQYQDGSNIPEEYLPAGAKEDLEENRRTDLDEFNLYYSEDEEGEFTFYRDIVE